MAQQFSKELTQPSLYEQDYCLWLETTAKLLRQKQFEALDLDNLIEEIEGLTRSDRRELRQRLTVLLEHLLKLMYWEAQRENNERGWRVTIREQRRQIKLLLEDSPSLKPFLAEVFSQCYTDAKEDVLKKTALPAQILPQSSPLSLESVLDPEYLPPEN